MSNDISLGDFVTFHEKLYELSQSGHLFLSWPSVLKIPDQTDAYAALVVGFHTGVSTVNPLVLEHPPSAHFNLPHLCFRTIPHNKVITESITPLSRMTSMKTLGATDFGRAVMNDNVLPTSIGGKIPGAWNSWEGP